MPERPSTEGIFRKAASQKARKSWRRSSAPETWWTWEASCAPPGGGPQGGSPAPVPNNKLMGSDTLTLREWESGLLSPTQQRQLIMELNCFSEAFNLFVSASHFCDPRFNQRSVGHFFKFIWEQALGLSHSQVCSPESGGPAGGLNHARC